MATTLRAPVAYTNIEQPDSNAARRETIDDVLGRVRRTDSRPGGIAAFVEAGKDAAYLHARAAALGMTAVVRGELAVVFDSARFDQVRDPGYHRIMVGGHVGADGVAGRGDDRRVGPSRAILEVDLVEILTGGEAGVDVWHPLAKVDTSAKWRRGLWALSARRAAASINARTKLTPNRFLIGDTNRGIPRVDLPGLAEVEVKTPATMGAARYDRIHRLGALSVVTPVLTFRTNSDHRGLYFSIVTPVDPDVDQPAPHPERPAPKPVVRRPVARPWRRRTRRWKRRHPILWRRIVAWRHAHPRAR